MGVAITSVSRVRFKLGLTWCESDARIAGTAPASAGRDALRSSRCPDQNSKLSADAARWHVDAGGLDCGETFAQRLVFRMPNATGFWILSLRFPCVPAASIVEVSVLVAEVTAEATLAEIREAQPAAIAALTRRFGIVESWYVANDHAKLTDLRPHGFQVRAVFKGSPIPGQGIPCRKLPS